MVIGDGTGWELSDTARFVRDEPGQRPSALRRHPSFAGLVSMLLSTLLLAIAAVAVVPSHAGAQSPSRPGNSNCERTVVVAKLSVTEDAAAANMLAEAIRILGLGGYCLIDAGDPDTGYLPPGSRQQATGAVRLFVVGGPAAISADWMEKLRESGTYSRVSGEDRWATQAAVASAIVGLALEPLRDPHTRDAANEALRSNTDCSGSAVLAKLSVIQDRAAANMLAEALRWLSASDYQRCLIDAGTPGTNVPPSPTARAEARRAAHIYLVGGPAAVSPDWIVKYFGNSAVERVWGADRWATQAAVANLIVRLARESGDSDAIAQREDAGASNVVGDEAEHADVGRGEHGEHHETVYVFHCGPAGSYGASQLEAEVQRLGRTVGRFYDEQFGESDFTLEFQAARVLSPELDWPQESLTKWRNAGGDSGCHDAFDEAIREPQNAFDPNTSLLIADVPFGGHVWGFAHGYGRGLAVVAASGAYPNDSYYLSAVAHELGHTLYAFHHPHDNNCAGTSSIEELKSIMTQPRCGSNQDIEGLTAYIMCSQRESLGWIPSGSCSAHGPPPNRPVVTGVHPSDGAIRLEWSAPFAYWVPVTSYEVQYRPTGTSSRWVSWPEDVDITGLSVTIVGLSNGVEYEVQMRARSRAGAGAFTGPFRATPEAGVARVPVITLKVGGDARGAIGRLGPCRGVHCRWLHVEVEGLGPGPHTLACAHNGVPGHRPGVFRSATVSSFPSTDDCHIGFADAQVYVIVGATHTGEAWIGGYRSNVVTWPNCNTEPARCKT